LRSNPGAELIVVSAYVSETLPLNGAVMSVKSSLVFVLVEGAQPALNPRLAAARSERRLSFDNFIFS
jgi:hypothetical protein